MAWNPRKRRRYDEEEADFTIPWSQQQQSRRVPDNSFGPPLAPQGFKRRRQDPYNFSHPTTSHVDVEEGRRNRSLNVTQGNWSIKERQPTTWSSHHCHASSRPPRRPTTIVTVLPYPAEGVEVVYSNNPMDADLWIKRNVQANTSVIGLDIEWRPQFVAKKHGGKENKTATLQLAVDSSCLVLHLFHMSLSSLPSSLCEVLANQNILKVGSGIRGDAIKLVKDTGLLFDGRADTQTYARAIGFQQADGFGLKSLANKVLGIDMNKPKIVTMSNWELCPLSCDQISYAALDAWIGLKLFQELKERFDKMESTSDEGELIETGMPFTKQSQSLEECRWCGKKFKGKDALETHIEVKGHKNSTLETTPEQNKEVPKEDKAEQVTKLESKVQDPQPLVEPLPILKCPLCEEHFKSEKDIQEHLTHFMHSSCQKCGKQFQHNVSKHHKKKCKGY